MAPSGCIIKGEAGSETTISKQVKPVKDIQIGEVIDELDFLTYSQHYNFFAFTIKPCSTFNKKKYAQNPQLLTEYVLQLAKINNFAVNELHYEFTTENKNGSYPHVHFTVLKKSTLTKLYSKGLSIYIEPIYNYDKWVSYCKKDQTKLLDEYSFIDE